MQEDVFYVRPCVSQFYLARLAAVNFYCRQADRNGGLFPVHATCRFDADDSVTPLVQAARLGLAASYLVRVRRIVSLGGLVDGLDR